VPKNNRSATIGVVFLCLFALPFAGVGVVMGWLLLSSLWTWNAMQSWREVPAIIHEARLDESRSDDSTTYRVEAAYTYEYGGRTFSGDRVSMYSGSDNIGAFHENAHRELSEHQTSGEPFRCYVNPRNPGEAVLYRDLRPEMLGFYGLFVLLFGGAGFGMMIVTVFVRGKMRTTSALRAEYPGQPWCWREDWRAGVIKSSNKGEMLASVVFAVVWNAVSSPVLFIVPEEAANGNPLILLALLFPLIGLGLIAWAVRNVVRWRKFGETTFQMAAVPGVVGGAIYGLIRIPTYIRPDDGFRLRLRCVKRVTTGSGKNKSTSEHKLWEQEQSVPNEQALVDPVQAAVPVRFDIPGDQPETDPQAASPIAWKLEVRAAVPGVDYSATFEVPVFRTDADAPGFDATAPLADGGANRMD